MCGTRMVSTRGVGKEEGEKRQYEVKEINQNSKKTYISQLKTYNNNIGNHQAKQQTLGTGAQSVQGSKIFRYERSTDDPHPPPSHQTPPNPCEATWVGFLMNETARQRLGLFFW